MFRNCITRLHFVGIGGIGMSGIAEVLLNLGYDVRGSDTHLSPITERLAAMRARIYQGHHAQNINDAEVVVISSAVKADNPEVIEARQRGIPVIRRAEMLAELMRMKYGIAVAGTHGKTTTTSLIATILHAGEIDPTVVIGGRLKSLKSNARLGEGEYLVAEADESDGSFLRLMPTLCVVTNIDAEHLDHWTLGLPQIVDAFVDFVNKVPFYGTSVLCVDHPTVQNMLPRVEKRFITYGFSPQADYCAESVSQLEGAMVFTVKVHGKELGRVKLNMIGQHNVLNALAAIAIADEVGVPFDIAAQALASFAGVGRRFEIKGEAQDVLVVDDYGHHPAEIRATLRAARESYNRRLVVAFQPHRYTRTRDLGEEFATSFNDANVLLLADIYAASETPIVGVTSERLVENIKVHGHQDVHYVAGIENMAHQLAQIVQPGDLVITLGAGNIWQSGEELLRLLATESLQPQLKG
ncbi:MAG: UDP-N-acetylmuramate--L-alanine ligase [Deltaproteobacteria bacterium]|nr:UDP-N-acetylmuramate--L-alanine ligase [Deltaproteobacteria bacterium]